MNHNMMMRAAWEDMIRPSDHVLHLGDVTVWYKTHAAWAHTVKKLPGKKFLIQGNHDGQWSWSEWRAYGFTIVDPFIYTPENWQGKIAFSHEPLTPSARWDYNIHGHTHNHSPYRRYEKLQSTYYNVSIEGMDYKPVRLGEILDELAS
jgi:calcineurin-like phosphoesterase family protein